MLFFHAHAFIDWAAGDVTANGGERGGRERWWYATNCGGEVKPLAYAKDSAFLYTVCVSYQMSYKESLFFHFVGCIVIESLGKCFSIQLNPSWNHQENCSSFAGFMLSQVLLVGAKIISSLNIMCLQLFLLPCTDYLLWFLPQDILTLTQHRKHIQDRNDMNWLQSACNHGNRDAQMMSDSSKEGVLNQYCSLQ